MLSPKKCTFYNLWSLWKCWLADKSILQRWLSYVILRWDEKIIQNNVDGSKIITKILQKKVWCKWITENYVPLEAKVREKDLESKSQNKLRERDGFDSMMQYQWLWRWKKEILANMHGHPLECRRKKKVCNLAFRNAKCQHLDLNLL
jgi:hypothetical protein